MLVVRFLCLAALLAVVVPQPFASPDARFSNVTAEKGFGGATLKIALHQEAPFVFYDDTQTGNARFTGITPDLVDQLAAALNFQYELSIDATDLESAEKALSAVMSEGGTPPTADVAGGALHITTTRIEAVHFSQAYFDTGYVVVVPRPKAEINLWAFLSPFSSDLWVCVVLEMVIVAALFFLMEAPRFTTNPDGDSDLVEGMGRSFIDALYWSVSALTCTLDKAPKTWAGKLVMLAHGWFFLIIIASYTANLASDLTASSLAPSITSWNDITSQGKSNKIAVPKFLSHDGFLSFETLHHGFQFDIEYTERWEDAMEATLRGTNGVAATFHDSAIVQYYLANTLQAFTAPEDRCGLMTVGAPFAPVGYGFAFPQDSAAYIAFSQGIVKLKEEGEIAKLLLKYGVGDKAAADIEALCPLTGDTKLYFKDFHGLCIMTGAICGAAMVVWAICTAACRGSKPEASTTDQQMVADFTHSRSEVAVEEAVRAGLQAALGDAATASSNSPAMQAYVAGLEVAIRAGVRTYQASGGGGTWDESQGAGSGSDKRAVGAGKALLVHVEERPPVVGHSTVDRGEV